MLISLLLPISFVLISLIYPYCALLATPSSGDFAAEVQLAQNGPWLPPPAARPGPAPRAPQVRVCASVQLHPADLSS